MIIVAGYLIVDPADREAYLAATAGVAGLARAAQGCLDFVQVADPLEADRVVIYERWSSDEELMAFRTDGTGVAGGTDDSPSPLPEVRGAVVAKYRISGIEPP